jgi:hypothetical protein
MNAKDSTGSTPMQGEISHFRLATRPATRRAALVAAAAAGLAATMPSSARQINPEDDVEMLNYLLGLEHLEVALAQGALTIFSDDDWQAVTGDGERTRLGLETIRDQEQAHIAALRDAIIDAGALPIDPMPYQFAYTDVAGFIRVAAGVGQTINAAYGGAIPLLADPAHLLLAVGIHSVEGRHAAWLKERAGESPFPDPIDQPLNRKEAIANLTGFTTTDPPAAVVVVTATPEPTSTPVEAIVVTATPEPTPVPAETVVVVGTVPPDARNVFAAIIRDAATRLNVPEETVEIVAVEQETWSDTSLDCPQPGEIYAQVLTDGYLVVVAVGNRELEYHTDLNNRFVLCTGN